MPRRFYVTRVGVGEFLYRASRESLDHLRFSACEAFFVGSLGYLRRCEVRGSQVQTRTFRCMVHWSEMHGGGMSTMFLLSIRRNLCWAFMKVREDAQHDGLPTVSSP